MVLEVLLSRWQFGVTITYHFLFVPLTIGLAMLVAVMQVLAYRRRDAVWERLSRFFGTPPCSLTCSPVRSTAGSPRQRPRGQRDRRAARTRPGAGRLGVGGVHGGGRPAGQGGHPAAGAGAGHPADGLQSSAAMTPASLETAAIRVREA